METFTLPSPRRRQGVNETTERLRTTLLGAPARVHDEGLMSERDDERDTVPVAERLPPASSGGERGPASASANTTTTRQMTQAFLDSDYPRAAALAETVLAEQPGDVMATAIAKECRAMRDLASSIPVRAVMWDERVDADADGVAASILSLVDGRTSVSEIAELAESSGLGPGEALRRIEEFIETGVLRLVPADEAVF